ncbi:MAG: GAF domain-containing protein [Oscillochloris sp.]|nr:GAF domain-containing protein [Oscillochloris sp.]
MVRATIYALLSGVAIGLAFAVAIRLVLRQAAIDLHAYAVELIDAPLSSPTSSGDDVVYMRETLNQALAYIPRPDDFQPLAGELATAADSGVALRVLVEYFNRHIPVQGAVLLLLDYERSLLYPEAIVGAADVDRSATVDLYASAIGRALRERRDVMYSSMEMRRLLPVAVAASDMSLFCLPLLVREQPYGMLCVLLAGGDARLNEAQRTYARSVTDMFILALQSAVYRQLFAREGDRLAAFEQLGNLIDDSERIDRALEQVLRVAARVTDSAHGTLLLLDPEEREVRLRITLKEGDVLPLSITAAPILRHGLAGWALRERRADLIDDTERDTRWLPVPGLDTMRSALVVPLLFGERALGILTLAHISPRHYSRRSLALASALAAYAVTVLARSRRDEMLDPGRHGLVRRAFEPYVAPEVLSDLMAVPELIERRLEPWRGRAVVLCVGVRGLDRIEDRSPDVLMREVIRPFSEAARAAILTQRGLLLHAGEGVVLGVFGYPVPDEAMAMQALQAAAAIQLAGRRLRKRWGAPGGDTALSVGVAYGDLVAGIIGMQPGEPMALFGAAIRDARRLQQLARADEVLVNELPNCDTLDKGMLESLAPLVTAAGSEPRPLFRLRRTPTERVQG